MAHVKTTLRQQLKKLAYSSRFLAAYHRARNRNTLTIAMFHRVLPSGHKGWEHADPHYSMTEGLFEACICFFALHYTIVGVDEVLAALGGALPLPARALLVTIDDGWADTETYALPVLERRSCPATVFVTSSFVGTRAPFWQERVFAAWRSGVADEDRLNAAWAASGTQEPVPTNWRSRANVRSLIAQLRSVEPAARIAIVEGLESGMSGWRAQMLSKDQLAHLYAAGIEIGAHGVTHEALAETPEGESELSESHRQLSELLGGAAVRTMSFPHGSYDDKLLATAQLEYQLVFTSDGHVNTCVDGRPLRTQLGRIGIPSDEISGRDGKLIPALLALWLFRRAHVPGAGR